MRPPHPGTPESRVGPTFTPFGEAGSKTVSIRQAAETARRQPVRQGRGPYGHAEGQVPAGTLLPAPASRFGITDPQQWIDLCG
jgi:hypothetical protein